MSKKEETGQERLTAPQAFRRLVEGNAAYLTASAPAGDISQETRARLYRQGQSPYAVVVTCSDSRVVPECIFSAGLGELFVVRTAGNVIGTHEMGSVEYAVSHLECPLVVVLGHTSCGAVAAAILREGHGHVKVITDRIGEAIGDETDMAKAAALNVRRAVSDLQDSLDFHEASIIGALYHTDSGKVEFLSEP